MKKKLEKLIKLCVFLLTLFLFSSANNLSNPLVLMPQARIAVGASYMLGGYSLTNREVPSIFNRFYGSVSYAPVSFCNFGIDAGATQLEVAGDTTSVDTFGIFHGEYGFSGGGHIKLGTPFLFNNLLAIIAIFHGTTFSSKNNNGTIYSGLDACGGIGVQFHISSFGYITAGSQIYLITGKNKNYLGQKGYYSNVNNMRVWIGFDYFPKANIETKNLLYVSFETAISPKVKFNARAPVEEISFSVSVGSVTPQLYGKKTEIDWNP